MTKDVEIFLPSTNSSKTCTRMSITGGRQGATLNTIAKEAVICGGNAAESQISTTCQVFRGRQWTHYADLLSDRLAHTTWLSPAGLVCNNLFCQYHTILVFANKNECVLEIVVQ